MDHEQRHPIPAGNGGTEEQTEGTEEVRPASDRRQTREAKMAQVVPPEEESYHPTREAIW